MAYEYEYEGKNMMAGVYSSLATNESVKELEEVYAKAKAFDEISQVFKKVTIYNTSTALEVKEILDKLEDK